MNCLSTPYRREMSTRPFDIWHRRRFRNNGQRGLVEFKSFERPICPSLSIVFAFPWLSCAARFGKFILSNFGYLASLTISLARGSFVSSRSPTIQYIACFVSILALCNLLSTICSDLVVSQDLYRCNQCSKSASTRYGWYTFLVMYSLPD